MKYSTEFLCTRLNRKELLSRSYSVVESDKYGEKHKEKYIYEIDLIK